jgi:predicted lipoprotein with Yx(FWY)xxD motif
MKTRVPVLAVAALAMIGLAGCSGTSTPPAADETTEESAPAEETPAAEEPEEEPAGDGSVMVASSDLGDIVVDAAGMTLYMFDNDTQGSGESSCTGECLTNWPPLYTTSETPEGTDITGELGTITLPDGDLQVTLNGWPLYYFAGDKAAGDVAGQGVGGIWWVLDPAGERMATE